MRLYTRTGATVLNDPEYGTFEADDQGAFELPDDLAERLHRFHVGKQPLWEDEEQRHQRIVDEEMARAKDPATLLAVVQQLAMLAKAAIPAQPDPVPAPAKRVAKRAGTPASE